MQQETHTTERQFNLV